MKILFYSDSAEVGGAEKYLGQIISGLKEKGDQTVTAHNAKELKEKISAEKPEIVHFNMPDVFSCKDAFGAAEKLKVIATVHSLSRTQALKAGRNFKAWIASYIPFWQSFDHLFGRIGFYFKRRGLMDRLLILSKIIAVSEAGRKELIDTFGLPPEKIAVIYNGIPKKEYPDRKTAREALGLNLNSPVIACIGRLVKNKGQDVFLKAAAMIKQKIPDARFLIAGDGYLKDPLKKLARKLGLRTEEIFLAYEKAPFVFGAMDISIVPSLMENLPYVVMESMLAGKPVVASAVGGIPELVKNGETGTLIKPNDPNELAEAIMKLINNKQLVGAMGGRGKERVLNVFSLGRMINETEKVFKAA
ncbi:MAG: glycosyltransferase family 4 protein [Candidatus Margulisiibacteriota bacterium]